MSLVYDNKKPAIDAQDDISCAAGSVTELIAEDLDRIKIVIGNLSTNTQTMRIGDSNAAADNGFELAPGGIMVFDSDCSMAWSAYNPGDSAESLTVTAVKIIKA